MLNQFKNALFTLALLAAITGLTTAARPAATAAPASVEHASKPATLSDLTVTKTSSTSVALSWIGSGISYTVRATNLTTQQVEQTFSTSATSASVSSLTAGHTYRFEVVQGSYVIAEDLIM